MNDYTKYRLDRWKSFVQRNNIREQGINLFSNNNLYCELSNLGKDSNLYLTRDTQMENLVIKEVSKLLNDFYTKSFEYDGLIYLMYFMNDGDVTPLYVGKTETLGKTSNLSANIKNLDKEKCSKKFFARWGDGYQYHFGDLSAVVVSGHDENIKT